MAKREQKIALVTGANKGIGFEVARQLAREGLRVFVGARNAAAGQAATKKLRDETSGDAVFLNIDVSKPDSIRSAADGFGKQADYLDVLVNNAAIAVDGDDNVLKISPEMFETTLRTNTLGPLLVSQAFIPLLKKSSAP